MPRNKGFTVLELLIVIAIIGVLASIVLVSVSAARNNAKNAGHIQNLIQIRNALELYAADHDGNYPDTHQNQWHFLTPDDRYDGAGFSDVLYVPGDGWIPGLVPNYIRELPKYQPDGKLPYNTPFKNTHRNYLVGPLAEDCSTHSTTYFYAGDKKSYKLIVACPEGVVNTKSPLSDPSPHYGLMVCRDKPFRGPLEGQPCEDNW